MTATKRWLEVGLDTYVNIDHVRCIEVDPEAGLVELTMAETRASLKFRCDPEACFALLDTIREDAVLMPEAGK